MTYSRSDNRLLPEVLLTQVDQLRVLKTRFDAVRDSNIVLNRHLAWLIHDIEGASSNVEFADRSRFHLNYFKRFSDHRVKASDDLSARCGRLIEFGHVTWLELRRIWDEEDKASAELKTVKSLLDEQSWTNEVEGLIPAWYELEKRLNPRIGELERRREDLKRRINGFDAQIQALGQRWNDQLRKAFVGLASDPRPVPGFSYEVPAFEGERTLWGENGVDPGDVQQRVIGDCFFAAPIAGMANNESGRRRLREMIRDNGDGTFTVRFGDGELVTVDSGISTTNTGDFVTGFGNDDSMAFPLIEKAYAVRRGGMDVIAKGGDPMKAMSDLGLNAELLKVSSKTPLTKLESKLELLNEGSIIVMTCFSSSGGGHALTVIGYDELTHTVRVRNPWGNRGFNFYASGEEYQRLLANSEGEEEGVYKMSIEEFARLADGLYYTTPGSG